MTTEVVLDALWEQIGVFGDRAFVVTVGANGRPHAVSVPVRVDGGRIVVAAGSTTAENVAARSAVMLLWPPLDDGPYSLLVDGDGEVGDGDELRVTPTSAVLHRVAGADEALASCVRVIAKP